MTRQLRVVHTVDSIAPHTGGPARSVPGLCRALAQDGVDVTLLAREIVAPMRLGAAIRAAAKTHPDLLHDHGVWLPGNHASAVAARRSRVKRVVSPRDAVGRHA